MLFQLCAAAVSPHDVMYTVVTMTSTELQQPYQ